MIATTADMTDMRNKAFRKIFPHIDKETNVIKKRDKSNIFSTSFILKYLQALPYIQT